MCNKRICKICKEEKFIDEFYPKKGGYFTHSCKLCLSKKQKSYIKDGEYLSVYQRERSLRENYKITLAEYDELLYFQDGKCAICGIHSSELNRSLAVDHDHRTGKIRGLLCNSCNQGLGYFKDKISNLEDALYYLILHK